MKILILEDEPVSRHLATSCVRKWGFEAVEAETGGRALEALTSPDGPRLALVDLMLPDMSGDEVCRKARVALLKKPLYMVIVSARSDRGDIVRAINAGADDYVVKPFHQEELKVRIEAGARVIRLQEDLESRVRELEKAVLRERELRSLLPVCSYCKRVREDDTYWKRVEEYIGNLTGASVTHCVCPDCMEKMTGQPQG